MLLMAGLTLLDIHTFVNQTFQPIILSPTLSSATTAVETLPLIFARISALAMPIFALVFNLYLPSWLAIHALSSNIVLTEPESI